MNSPRPPCMVIALALLAGASGAVPTVSGGAAPSDSAVAAPDAPPGYSAAALYNLANSYARTGRPGLAVLNYERAGLLAPNDPDIDANLSKVRRAAHLAARSPNGFDRAATLFSSTIFAWIGLAGVLLAGAGLVAGRLWPRRAAPRRAAMTLGLVLIGLTVCNGVALWPTLHSAVVLGAAPVRVSPVPMGDPLFVLPEAETVRVTAEHEDFVLIETQAGRTGWVARAGIAPIVAANVAPLARR